MQTFGIEQKQTPHIILKTHTDLVKGTQYVSFYDFETGIV